MYQMFTSIIKLWQIVLNILMTSPTYHKDINTFLPKYLIWACVLNTTECFRVKLWKKSNCDWLSYFFLAITESLFCLRYLPCCLTEALTLTHCILISYSSRDLCKTKRDVCLSVLRPQQLTSCIQPSLFPVTMATLLVPKLIFHTNSDIAKTHKTRNLSFIPADHGSKSFEIALLMLDLV